jgi:4-hydroxy-tetrahydrodipicolinate synthase
MDNKVAMNKRLPSGVWPVMVTPLTAQNQIDFEALGPRVEWYIDHGVAGLFTASMSSSRITTSGSSRR